jgi:hypothetical protein
MDQMSIVDVEPVNLDDEAEFTVPGERCVSLLAEGRTNTDGRVGIGSVDECTAGAGDG